MYNINPQRGGGSSEPHPTPLSYAPAWEIIIVQEVMQASSAWVLQWGVDHGVIRSHNDMTHDLDT